MNEWLITWLTMWPLWAGMLLCLPAIMMSPGCGCCEPPPNVNCDCRACGGEPNCTMPTYIDLEVEGIVNGACSYCDDLNRTYQDAYQLYPITLPCLYTATQPFLSDCGAYVSGQVLITYIDDDQCRVRASIVTAYYPTSETATFVAYLPSGYIDCIEDLDGLVLEYESASLLSPPKCDYSNATVTLWTTA